MFAPDGFVAFFELAELARNVSRDICSAYRSEKIEGEGYSVEYMLGERDAVECWLIGQALGYRNLYVCSPQGVVLRGPTMLVRHMDNLEMLPCPVPIEDSSLKLPNFGTEFELPVHQYFVNRFVFFDWHTGQIKSNQEIREGVADYSQFSDETEDYLIERHSKVANALSEYAGWSICIKESDFGESEAEVFAAFGVDDALIEKINMKAALPLLISNESKRGRPRKRDEAMDAYWQLYPDGHSVAGVTLKEATNAVSREMGQLISDDTLRRALGKKP